MANELDFIRTELQQKHAQRVPADARGTFLTTGTAMLDIAEAQRRDFAAKLKTGIYHGPARDYLAAQLRDEARAMFDVQEDAILKGVREGLDTLRVTATTVPQNFGHEVAREIRDVLRAMPKDERENAVALSTDPQIAAAVLNAPGDGVGLGVTANAKRQLLRSYNETHRPGLLQQIADAEALIGAVEEFRRTVSVALREILK